MSGRWTRHWNERGAVLRLCLLEKVDTFDITSLLCHCTATTVGVCLRLLARSSLYLSHRCPRTRRRGTACPLVVRWLLAESLTRAESVERGSTDKHTKHEEKESV